MPAEPVKLTYWEATGEYLSEAGVAQLDKEFMAKYPNITLDRVAKPFADIMATEKLQASGPNPPDILLTNAGFGLLGPLVAANLVLPLDSYAEQFGWKDRFGESVLRVQSFSPDGKSYGTGNLYGVSPAATYVGLYYNKDIMTQLGLQPPATYEELYSSLKTAKAGSVVPICSGIQDGWPAVHTFTSLQNIEVPTQKLRDIVFHTDPNASFDTPENIAAAKLGQQLGQEGFYSPGYQGKTVQSAIDDFIAGKCLYFMQGTYFAGPIKKGLGDKAAMMLFPGHAGGPFTVTGASGLSWSISSKSKIPDAAACYLDWRTGTHAAELYVAEGGLPSNIYNYTGDSQFTKSIFDGWAEIAQKDALVPYIDWAATNLLDVLSSAAQQLVGGKLTPEEFVKQVQKQYEKFQPGT